MRRDLPVNLEMAVDLIHIGEADLDESPSSAEIISEATQYLDLKLATKRRELLEAAAQANLNPTQAVSAALKIQDLALSMVAQIDEVMLELARSSEDFSPKTLSAAVLKLNLESIPDFEIIFRGRKKLLKSKGFDAERISDLLLTHQGKLIMDVMKVWTLGDKRLTQIVELYLRKNLPIGRLLAPADLTLFNRLSKE